MTMAAQGEINVFGKLVSQTTNGVLAGANQIHDPNMNKMQSVINADVLARLDELEGLAGAGMVL